MTLLLQNMFASLVGTVGLMIGCAAGPDIDQAPAVTDQDPPVQVAAQIPADQQQPAAEEPTEEPDVEPDAKVVELLKQIEAVSSEINTLKARIRYTRLQTLTGDQQRRYGDFYYAAATDDKPTLFAVLFARLVVDGRARPMQTWYIFDGNWLLERDHEDKTATRRELVPEGAERSDVLSMGDGQMPIPLRLKADEVLKTYRVDQLADEPLGEDQILVHLRLSPKQAGGDTAPLDLWFDKQTLALYKVVTTEDTDEIEILFPKRQPNAEIAPGVFDTALPDKDQGWQVQEVPIKG